MRQIARQITLSLNIWHPTLIIMLYKPTVKPPHRPFHPLQTTRHLHHQLMRHIHRVHTPTPQPKPIIRHHHIYIIHPHNLFQSLMLTPYITQKSRQLTQHCAHLRLPIGILHLQPLKLHPIQMRKLPSQKPKRIPIRRNHNLMPLSQQPLNYRHTTRRMPQPPIQRSHQHPRRFYFYT